MFRLLFGRHFAGPVLVRFWGASEGASEPSSRVVLGVADTLRGSFWGWFGKAWGAFLEDPSEVILALLWHRLGAVSAPVGRLGSFALT